jgi:tetratricopeptide (TPR) repeat protein
MSESPPSINMNKPMLSPPAQAGDQRREPASRYTRVWISLAAVLLIGLAVVVLLPKFVAGPPAEDASPQVVIPAGTDTRSVANELMQAYLQLHARLLLENAPQWGKPRWGQAEEHALQGSGMFAQHNFSASARHYAAAIEILQELQGGRESRISDALAIAYEALERNEVISAIENFEQVLAIEPGNEAARYGLTRSHTRIAVLENMTIGEQAEARKDLPAAQEAYQEAMLLDPNYEPPATAFQRVTDTMESDVFQNRMSRALISLNAGNLGRAESALAEAAAIRPNDPAVQDLQQRLTATRKQSAMTRFRKQAASLSRVENWKGAVDVYNKALAADPAASFARSGLEKAEARLAVNQQFDHYLKQPERLFAAEPLANAETLLQSVPAAPPEEPKLANKIARLQKLVDGANTPVAVTLSSDGETEVSIYHIGPIGSFTEQQLELLPGKYTVVGSRYGYRDVLKELKVIPGTSNKVLSIQCEDPI